MSAPTPHADHPLTVRLTEEGVVEISIGIQTLAHAAKYHPIQLFYPATKEPFQITDPIVFAREVVSVLRVENHEDGSTRVTRMLEDAILEVFESGEGFEIRD